ncbi:hypothetical protein ABE430_26690, partial [Brevibacillus agri]|uniref:hypothetical protein n=1 Tax=Brevibacillus agri TaxID=51101 RepID=UPI003D210CF3
MGTRFSQASLTLFIPLSLDLNSPRPILFPAFPLLFDTTLNCISQASTQVFSQAFSPFFRYDFKLLKLSDNLRVKSRKSSSGKGLSGAEKVDWGYTTLFSLH